MTRFPAVATSLLRKEEAATMPEYALMVALIAVICIGAVTLLGGNVSAQFTNLAALIGA